MRRRAISAGVRPAWAKAPRSASRLRVRWQARPRRSAATRPARRGSSEATGRCGRKAVERGVSGARARRRRGQACRCQPRGRPRAASTASKTAWSPSVISSAVCRQRAADTDGGDGHGERGHRRWRGRRRRDPRYRPGRTRRRPRGAGGRPRPDRRSAAAWRRSLAIWSRQTGMVNSGRRHRLSPVSLSVRKMRPAQGPRLPCRGTDRPAG